MNPVEQDTTVELLIWRILGDDICYDGMRMVAVYRESKLRLEIYSAYWDLNPSDETDNFFHLRAWLEEDQLKYIMRLGGEKKFSNYNKTQAAFLFFAHGERDDWEWREEYSGSIPLEKLPGDP